MWSAMISSSCPPAAWCCGCFRTFCPGGRSQLLRAGSGRIWPDVSGLRWNCMQMATRSSAATGCWQFAATVGIPPVASGDVHMHIRGRRAVQDTLTAIRRKLPLGCGVDRSSSQWRAAPPHTRRVAAYLPRPSAARLVWRLPRRLQFSLDELRYQYPHELVPSGHTPGSWLRCRTHQGARERWPAGAPAAILQLLEHELALISELGYEPYFLTVDDLVRFARSRGILCQGRGSAANSVVCFCLGITEVDPARMSVLFERFMSRERNEPPDIDVDFEHERREEVIQYIYARYGRDRAALTATVITYCPAQRHSGCGPGARAV